MTSLYRYNRIYTGPVKACILDWCGTSANKYSLATTRVFDQFFKKYKVPIGVEHVRKSIGLRMDLQILEILKIPSVSKRWKDLHGQLPNEADVNSMYSDFVPMFMKSLHEYGELIPGTSKAIDSLKTDLNCKIGSTTCLSRSMVDILLNAAVKQGYHPNTTVASDEVNNGIHPKPHMIYKSMGLLDISPIQSVVKVGATSYTIHEALEAGCWAVAVSRYSNYMNINSFEEENEVSEDDMKQRNTVAQEILINSGAHYVIDSIVQLPDIVNEINHRLSKGEKP
ncbi:phosphonoacetaldehyde hydrolase-like [Tubulanus polymorphus]|uniref:phosphonoacetaldehyde hydrolase-like n=1 Tax=Tubulanus polymorphus TaxID=672921 RepID=UPI003DA4EA94